MAVLLECRELVSGYGEKRVLMGVSLAVAAGEIVTLAGPNGAGKSTLLKALVGLLPARAGSVHFDGAPVTSQVAQTIRRGMAYCPQGAEVFRELSVDENLLVAGRLAPDRHVFRRNQDWIFTLYPILHERRRKLAGFLSGGERQMLAIALALMTSPRLLLLDEPSGGLSPLNVDKLYQSVARINRESGAAIVVAEQNLKQVLTLANRVYTMAAGRLAVAESAALAGGAVHVHAL